MLSEMIYEEFENSFYEYGENRDLCLKIILNSEKAEDIIDFYCEGKTDDFEDALIDAYDNWFEDIDGEEYFYYNY